MTAGCLARRHPNRFGGIMAPMRRYCGTLSSLRTKITEGKRSDSACRVVAAFPMLLAVAYLGAAQAAGDRRLPPLVEPWLPLHGGAYSDQGAPENPDPLRDYTWDVDKLTNASALQFFTMPPLAAVEALPPPATGNTAFTGLSTLVNATGGTGSARAIGSGTLVVDFGVELAGWIELRSPDLSPAAVAAGCVTMSVSESSAPQRFGPERLPPQFNGWKTAAPVPYLDGVFRLELNAQLYEGVRFGFLHVNATCASEVVPFTITSLVAQAQIKPVNWVGSFSAPTRPVLSRAWYVAAYTVKLNLLVDEFGAILDDRGDRKSFTGDAHPSQAASMAAFANFDFVLRNLISTGANTSQYGTYPMYWILSLRDYFAASGDAASVRALLPTAVDKLAVSRRRTLQPVDPSRGGAGTQWYCGWDERFNFAKLPWYPENGYVMKALFVRAAAALAQVADAVGNTTVSALAREQQRSMTAVLRGAPGGQLEQPGSEWWRSLGLHASAHAVVAGVVNATEAPQVFALRFNDSGKICSYSNFNQYNILQALGRLSPAHALESIALCWGAELSLGATSFWEVSGYGGQWFPALGRFGQNPPPPAHSSGGDSECHPWSAGVSAWLSSAGAGVAGCTLGSSRCVTIKPLIDVINANVTVSSGVVELRLDATTGKHAFSLPAGVVADIWLPRTASCPGETELEIDGARVAIEGIVTATGSLLMPAGLPIFSEYVHVDNLVAGTGRMQTAVVSCAKKTIQPQLHLMSTTQLYTPQEWDIPLLGVDNATRGSWLGKYGAAGHFLFGLSPAQLRLPRFVLNVTQVGGDGFRLWNDAVPASAPKFKSALQLPSSPAGARSIGYVQSADLNPVAVEVAVNTSCLRATRGSPSACFNLTLYMVDWDGSESPLRGSGNSTLRQQAIDVFTVAPDEFIDVAFATAALGQPQLSLGQHVTWLVCASALSEPVGIVRLRLYPATGPNAVASAMFFD